MTAHLILLFLNTLFISLLSFGAGGAPAYFYQFGVVQTHWITKSDLSSVLAFGFATPGPAANGTASFIGYHVAGLVGFIVGTIGIFISPLILSIIAAKYFNKLHEHVHAKQFIKGVGIAASGVVATTAISLLPKHEVTNVYYVCITIGAFIAIAKWKLNPLLVLVAGGVLGLL